MISQYTHTKQMAFYHEQFDVLTEYDKCCNVHPYYQYINLKIENYDEISISYCYPFYDLAKMTNPSSISNPCEGKTGSIITMKPRLEKKTRGQTVTYTDGSGLSCSVCHLNELFT